MPVTHLADPDNLTRFFRRAGRTVLTFLGYSAGGYEYPAGMIAGARRVLAGFSPATTLVNIGGTADGIGALYPIARNLGYATAGIVSTRAKKEGVVLSPDVDDVFYVEDDQWGGIVAATGRLSPTSAAMVECSDVVVAIGGDGIARDELAAANAAGKEVHFIAADMNHEVAREKARRNGNAPPDDFRGAASTVL